MATNINRALEVGDIIRYSDGVSALVKLEQSHAGGWHCSHVLGGPHFVSDGIFNKLKLANAEDIRFCMKKRPDWFKEIKTNLTFEMLKVANLKRSTEKVFPSHDWSLAQWACAMAGEAGEACNVVKKMFRGDFDMREKEAKEALAKELADTVIYVDLLAQKAGINLGTAIIDKFNEVSNKKGAATKL